ncbi:MAG: methyltransferase [Sphingomonadales bacterium]|nr:MAG: methyltransferase [Sphingomonadales bacterium]
MTIQQKFRPAAIEANLNFLEPMSERPVTWQYDPPPGVPVRNFDYAPQRAIVRDGRPFTDRFTLDGEGFALLRAPGTFTLFDEEAAIRSHYYREVERLLAAATGAAAIAFDHNVRSNARIAAGEAGIRPPVDRAHNDFTALSGHKRVRRELAAQGLDPSIVDGRRHAIVNLWRPIGRIVEKSPLALCDASSLSDGDLIASDLIYRDRMGEIYNLVFNPAQRWYYFPHMSPDEAILIKGFDSLEIVARFAPHTAFDDPFSPPDAPERESIETRALLIYPA